MNNINNPKGQIESLRNKLNYLVLENEDLTSSEVISISQELDMVLNQYNKDSDLV